MATPLRFREKLGYGLGDMASNFYMGFFGIFLLYYYTDIYGIAPAAVATMLLVTKIIDAVSDPAMGLIADRTESRFGKYRPYLLYAAIPYGLLGYALFLGPDLGNTGKLIYAYITYSAVMLAYTAINVPYSALLAVISPLAEERTKATTYRFAMASIGTLCVAAFATPLAGWLGGDDELLGFRLTMAVFALASVALFWTTFASTKERIRPPATNASVGEDFAALAKNVSWIALAISGILIVTGLIARMSSIAYYVKYYLNDDGITIFLIFDRMAVFTSCGLLGQLTGAMLTPLISRYMDKHRIVTTLCIVHAVLLSLSFTLPADSYWLAVTLHTLAMATFGTSITLLFAMYTDCAEYGEWQTGRRTSGLIVSASMFSLKFGSAVGAAIPGFVLAAFGFVANTAQSATSILGIQIMFNLVPGVLMLLGGAALLFYRIDRQTLQRIETELNASRN